MVDFNSGEGDGTPLQYPCLENPMDGGAWWATVHGVTKSRTWLSEFTFTFYFHALEKEMATHSSFLAWRIPGMVEPGGLPSMGSHRVGHDWSDLAAAAFADVVPKLKARREKDAPNVVTLYWGKAKLTRTIYFQNQTFHQSGVSIYILWHTNRLNGHCFF